MGMLESPVSSHAARIAATTCADERAGGSAVQALDDRRHTASRGDLADRPPDRRDDPVPWLQIDVADVDLKSHSVGDAVDRTRVHPADARRRHGVGAAIRTCRPLRRRGRLRPRRTAHLSGPAISTAPAWPPSPSHVTRSAAGAAIAVTMPIGSAAALEQRALARCAAR